MKLWQIYISLVLFNNILYADLAGGVLERYKSNSNVFVCVGIYSCVNLARALNAGFKELHGIDKDIVLVKHAKVIFPQDINNNPYNVKDYYFHHGDLEKLQEIISRFKQPIVILLGDHFPHYDEPVYNNMLEQLQIIKNHPIKNHIILIDYINHAGTAAFGGITEEQIKQALLEINHHYRFAYARGGCIEQEDKAILVAYL